MELSQLALNDSFNIHCIGTELKFVIYRKCYISGKSILFKRAYRQTAMWTGPGTPVFDYRWYDKDEFLLAKLKGKL